MFDETKQPQPDENDQRQQFCGDQYAAENCTLPNAQVVGDSRNGDENSHRCPPNPPLTHIRPKARQIEGEQIGIHGPAANSREKPEPADLDARETSQESPTVQVCAARLGEVRRDFDGTRYDDRH